MCFKGTEHRPTAEIISTELDTLGADYNAFTGHEYTGYYVKVAAPHASRAFDIISDIYLNPKFEAEEIEKEKGVIVGEIDMRNDMLPSRASELFMELLYGDQPAGWPIAGPREQIHTFTREQFLDYRKRQYVPSATLVVIAGGFDAKLMEKAVRARFGKVANSKKSTKKKVLDRGSGSHVRILEKQCDQTHIVLGVRALPLKHKDIPAANVLGAILGSGMSSRLFRKMRGELGLGYYAHAAHDAMTDHGMFVAAAGVENARTEEAIMVMFDELRRTGREPLGADELAKVKDMLAGRLYLGLESSDDLCQYYGFQELLKKELRTPEEALARIRAVRAQDVQRLAKKLFAPGRFYCALIGPHKDTAKFEKLLR